ncbi:YciI family protein [Streptomyces sp. NPDC052396]|uniref:YciI family protein n=1 Tax=Streptomyces sp. NPDC052396 TaxID=3365689 RepID=UPI0037D7AB49
MPQYAVLIFERENRENAELPPAVLRAHEQLPERIAEQGGRIVAGMALEASDTATALRDDVITDGPFIETKEALAGVFVIEARDLDHALALARLTPVVNGGVEVRPLAGLQIMEDN